VKGGKRREKHDNGFLHPPSNLSDLSLLGNPTALNQGFRAGWLLIFFFFSFLLFSFPFRMGSDGDALMMRSEADRKVPVGPALHSIPSVD
jgi:hypothetical protein